MRVLKTSKTASQAASSLPLYLAPYSALCAVLCALWPVLMVSPTHAQNAPQNATQNKPCGAWKNDPAAISPLLLAGVGSAAKVAADPVAAAKQQALQQMIEQIRVQVSSVVESDKTAIQKKDAAGTSTSVYKNITERITTQSKLALEGAEVIDSCTEGVRFYILLGVDRQKLADNAQADAQRLRAQIDGLVNSAQQKSQAGETLGAASDLWQAIIYADQEEEKSLIARVVRKTPLGINLADPNATRNLLDPNAAGNKNSTPTPLALRNQAKQYASQTKIFVDVKLTGLDGQAIPNDVAASVKQAAHSCLGIVGFSVANTSDQAQGVLSLDVNFRLPAPLYNIQTAQATLGTALRLQNGNTLQAASEMSTTGGGPTVPAAVTDAMRNLSKQKIAPALDEVFRRAGWQTPQCNNSY